MGSSLESRNAVCALSVVSHFRFWVVLLGCLSCDATKRLISPPDPNLVQLDDHGHTVIPPRMGSCEVDTDCQLVQVGCICDCTPTAINQASAAEYAERFSELCEDFSGQMCKCASRPVKSVCSMQTCTVEVLKGGR